jgi:tetratricopeptide (TPR) repeat protein
MEAYMNQGLLYSKLKNYSKSIKYYNKAIEIMPNDPCVHMG